MSEIPSLEQMLKLWSKKDLWNRIQEKNQQIAELEEKIHQDEISLAVYELSLVNGMLTDAIIEITQNETDANKLYYLEKIAKKFAEKTGGRINELKENKSENISI